MADDQATSIYIYGADGLGMVLAEAADATGLEVLGFLDELAPLKLVGRWAVRAAPEPGTGGQGVIVAIDDNMARRRIAADIVRTGLRLTSVIHPHATVSPSAIIGDGVYVGPGAVIGAHAQIDNGVMINSGTIVEHNALVAAFASIGPGATLGAKVQVGALTSIGAAAVVKAAVRISEDCHVDIGAAVVSDLAHGCTVAGVPAELIDDDF